MERAATFATRTLLLFLCPVLQPCILIRLQIRWFETIKQFYKFEWLKAFNDNSLNGQM